MERQQGVKVIYKNNQTNSSFEKEYLLKDYCDMLREDLLRLITDVEDMAYEANGGKRKEEWSDATWTSFCKIKHKILDKANAIGRVPENIVEGVHVAEEKEEPESETLSTFVAKVFGRG